MNNNHKLNGIVSIGAAVAAATIPAGAVYAEGATSALDGYNLTIDGGLSFSDFSEESTEGKIGNVEPFGADKGFFASVALSRQISDTWDWRISGSLNAFKENESVWQDLGDADDDDDDDLLGTFDQSLKGVRAGFDFGRTMKTGNTDIRLGFGVLAAQYRQDLSFGYLVGPDQKGVEFDTYQKYTGVGPALSADFTHPIAANGRTSLIGGASVAQTYGDFTVDANIPDTETEPGKALISSAYLGVQMQANESTSLRMGVRLDGFKGELSDIPDGGIGISSGDTLMSTTAFVGLNIQF